MKTALIPPLKYLYQLKRSNYQLMLPHIADPNYIQAYVELARNPNQYIILDNGVAEGEAIPFEEVHAFGSDIVGVDEFVLPDVLGDAEATIAATVAALEFLDNQHHRGRGHSYMAVLQGQNIDEVFGCYYELRYRDFNQRIRVWGLPRHLLTTIEPSARLRLAEDLGARYETVHLLGTNPVWIREARYAASLPNVRGVDTSAPYVYGAAHTTLSSFCQHHRKEDYFTHEYTPLQSAAIENNVVDYLGWQS